MLQHEEMDPNASLESQFADNLDKAVILINLFTVDPKDEDDFKRWLGRRCRLLYVTTRLRLSAVAPEAFRAVICS